MHFPSHSTLRYTPKRNSCTLTGRDAYKHIYKQRCLQERNLWNNPMPIIRKVAEETGYIHTVEYDIAVEITDRPKEKWGNFKFRTNNIISQVIID